jgi:flagellar biosynthesis/type III secretory pathway M-ring protein FliF/YscJ
MRINKEMANPPLSNKPSMPPPAGGNKAQLPVAKPVPQKTTAPEGPATTKEEAIKRLLAQMVDSDPAKMAEIIHQWLNEDKK